MYIIPDSYQHSRDIFRNDLAAIKLRWQNADQSCFFVSDKEDLTIDWIAADADQKPRKLIFLTTGLHGIEGYLGSIMLQLFVNEFMYFLDPSEVGILLVHCINPSGMKRQYRTNSANVDLNRNFIDDFVKMREINPDYSRLHSIFNPNGPIKSERLTKFLYIFQTLKWLALIGPDRVRTAALMGQYLYPLGMYFGGHELQAETKFMMSLIKTWIPRYQKTVHLDMHTGYGPRYQMTLVQSPTESMTSAEAQLRFNVPLVAATNPEEFYQIHGEMADFVYREAAKSNRKVYSAAFEFGTYGESLLPSARSLLTTILANQKINHPNPKSEWVNRDYVELYFPSEPAWLESAITNGRQAFKGILEAEGFI